MAKYEEINNKFCSQLSCMPASESGTSEAGKALTAIVNTTVEMGRHYNGLCMREEG